MDSSVIIIILIGLLFLAAVICFQIKEHYDQQDPMLLNIKKTLMPLHPKMKEIKIT